METPLFEQEPPPPPRGAASFTVAQFNELIGRALTQVFPDDVWVEGEISNLRKPKSGHVYFDLIEPTQPGVTSAARISVVLWNSTKLIVNKQLKKQNVGAMGDGMAVRIRAAVDFFEAQGKLQLRMTGIDPRYILAAMAAEREALIERLHREGLTEQNKRLPIPVMPLRVGLVTGAKSAAEADFLEELKATPFSFHVVICNSKVQGEHAPTELVAGLRTLYRRDDLDLIAVVRGGGARGDLAVFDNELVARTIAASPVPVLTGIGHEIDRSVADVVSHQSLKTPTAVAGALIQSVERYVEHVEAQWHGISHLSQRRIDHAEQRLDDLAARSARAGRDGLLLAEQRLHNLGSLMSRAGMRSIERAAQRLNIREGELPKRARRALRDASSSLDHSQAHLNAYNPSIMLERGWSITRTPNGDVIRSVADVDSGDTLVTQIADGALISNISVVDPEKDTEQ